MLLTNERRHALRRGAIGVYRAGARSVVFLPGPRVFVASQPKTGSHLLNALLSCLPKMMFSGVHYSPDDFVYMPTPHAVQRAGGRTSTNWEALHRALASIRKGQFLTTHWPAKDRLNEILNELDYRAIFMVRDPRDTVVSHAFYVTREASTYLHHRYRNVFRTTEERIMACINGFPSDEHGRGMHPLGHRLSEYLSWLDAPATYVCRFETLIGPAGGGSDDAQREEILSVAQHVDRELSPSRAAALARTIWSPRSFTFRKGRVGDWRNHFTKEHKAAFKEEAGRYLIDLGYESDFDW